LQRLLGDLLEYNKMSQSEPKLESINLGHAVSEALALLDDDIRHRNALVTVKQPLPDVLGHLATLVLLINNFISNALKFMPGEVRPQIRIWAESRKSESTSMPPSERQASQRADAPSSGLQPPTVRLWVEDNGIGIASEHLEKIFDAFERLHSKNTYPGTGLGLAIVRKGAQRMGGQVGVESEPGKGSRFWVELRIPES